MADQICEFMHTHSYIISATIHLKSMYIDGYALVTCGGYHTYSYMLHAPGDAPLLCAGLDRCRLMIISAKGGLPQAWDMSQRVTGVEDTCEW